MALLSPELQDIVIVNPFGETIVVSNVNDKNVQLMIGLLSDTTGPVSSVCSIAPVEIDSVASRPPDRSSPSTIIASSLVFSLSYYVSTYKH
jgi:hypothetical protein